MCDEKEIQKQILLNTIKNCLDEIKKLCDNKEEAYKHKTYIETITNNKLFYFY